MLPEYLNYLGKKTHFFLARLKAKVPKKKLEILAFTQF